MSTAVAVRDQESTALAATRPALGLIRPIASPSDVLQLQEETRTMVTQILQEGRDYGVIPGTDKPSMLKPGAERTALAFGCYYGEPEIVEREVDHDRVNEYTKRKKVWKNEHDGDRRFDWSEEHGTSRGLYRYVVRVPVIHRESGLVVGSAIGSCSTMESKYIDRPRDSENTALKMAHKRALVGACLITFGLSDQFTQDTEDIPREQLVGENAPKLEPMDPPCPKCKGKMYDNRLSKKSAKQPDFKCKNKQCDGVIWPPKGSDAKPTAAAVADAEERAIGDTIDAHGGAAALTLEDALAMPLPGAKSAWNGQGGTALGLLNAKMLVAIEKWLNAKIEEAATDGREDLSKIELLEAVKLVSAHKQAEANRDQTKLDLASPAAGSAKVDGAVPPGGKVQDALEPNAPKVSVADVAMRITALLQHEKFSVDERKKFRADLDKATTLEEFETLARELQILIDQPF